jgi:DNA polymerase-3 subunit epsilon
VGRSELTTELIDGPVAFVDIETTGGHPAYHRIVEVAVIGATGGKFDFEWSALINPGTSLPPSIQRLTGIHDDMLRDAPTFRDIANELESRLAGRLFIAHNVRFDYGFIRREFKHMGREWQSRMACTVRLSRALYPDMPRHNLDAVILRHELQVPARHRAMPDAMALWQFWRKLREEWPADVLAAAVKKAAHRPALPAQLPADLPDELPDAPGVYRFFGDGDALIYVGKADNIRERVLDHFRSATRDTKSQRLAAQTQRVEWRETAGELGALLLEARMVREEQPVYNRRLRGGGERLTWVLDDAGNPPRLAEVDADLLQAGVAFGLYRSERDARKALESLAREQHWCLKVLGLESGAGSCFGFQVGRCKGACCGHESAAVHLARVKLGLARERLASWPYRGAVCVREAGSGGRAELHVVNAWQHLGSFDEEEFAAIAPGSFSASTFDIDTYRILTRALKGKRYRVVELAGGGAASARRAGAPRQATPAAQAHAAHVAPLDDWPGTHSAADDF